MKHITKWDLKVVLYYQRIYTNLLLSCTFSPVVDNLNTTSWKGGSTQICLRRKRQIEGKDKSIEQICKIYVFGYVYTLQTFNYLVVFSVNWNCYQNTKKYHINNTWSAHIKLKTRRISHLNSRNHSNRYY